MLAGRSLRSLAQCGSRLARNAKKQRALSTTVNPEYEQDDYVLRNEQVIQIPDITVPELIWENVDKWEDKFFSVCHETGRGYKYGELRRLSNNLAKNLRGRLKLQRGQTVAVLLPNVPEYSIVLLGIFEANLVATTINPIYKADEIARQLVDSDSQAIITLGEYHKRTLEACQAANRSIPIITIKTTQSESVPSGAIDFAEFCTRKTEFNNLEPGNPHDVIVMPYSSGTTGLPKGVELTHRNLVANLLQATEVSKVIRETTKHSQDVVPAVLPMFHIYGMNANALKLLQLGCKQITMPKFTPDLYIDMLHKHKPHHLYIVPPIAIFLAAHPGVTKSHLDSVISITSGAAPLGATDMERLYQKTRDDLVALQGYGMTESSPVISMTPPHMWRECLGSIGTVIANTEVKICALDDDSGTPLGPNEQGEMLVRGPQVMTRYHNNPEATKETFQDGWLKTGDMAYYNDKKILWITDRLKELIKVKGFQVAPAELEAIIRDHPDVADAAVIGIPHPISGEVPKAFVVPRANTKINTEQIQDFVAKKVASYKRLEGGVTVLDAIPKNASGKIMRRTLKLEYADN